LNCFGVDWVTWRISASQRGGIRIAYLRGHLFDRHPARFRQHARTIQPRGLKQGMLEPSMLAPVLSQPALPLYDPADLQIAPEELQAVKQRLDQEGRTVMAYRFEGDRFCRSQRFATYRESLGERFVARILPDSAANPNPPPFFRDVVQTPHNVVTVHLIDEAGQPTLDARDEILRFSAHRLLRS
jgi:hypothetical protein